MINNEEGVEESWFVMPMFIILHGDLIKLFAESIGFVIHFTSSIEVSKDQIRVNDGLVGHLRLGFSSMGNAFP